MLTPISAHSGYWTPGARILPASIRAWYDESTTLTTSAWNDRSGNARHLGPGGGSLSTDARKGRRTSYFFGTEHLQATFSNAQPFTIFYACKLYSWSGTERVLLDGVATQVRMQQQSDTTVLLAAPTGLTATMGSSLTNRWVALAAVFNGANSSIWENGVLRASGDAGANNPTGLHIGAANDASRPFVEQMGEIILVSGALTTSQIARVSNYLMVKWG